MSSIESLLNPEPSSPGRPRSSEDYKHQAEAEPTPYLSPTTTLPERQKSGMDFSSGRSQTPPNKKARVAKDAPVFVPGDTRGEVRYPPCTEQSAELREEHTRFKIYPAVEDIAKYPRHIPYSSDKKKLMIKTGRESFEVYQYTFKKPGEEKIWTIMWDYNIGLVRTTHLFKCLNFPKTTPAKTLNLNEGLREICHSITGGALAAQGYWMPFETAKAIAATFCYEIRFVLTPVFGTDFPSKCLLPGDPNFKNMVIDREIIQRATELSTRYLKMELNSKSFKQTQHHRLHSPSDPTTGMRGTTAWSGEPHSSDGHRNAYFQPHPYQNTLPAETKMQPENSFIAVNCRNSKLPPPVSPLSKFPTPETLPSIQEVLGGESFESLCANPLKRRLLHDSSIHDEEEQAMKRVQPPLLTMSNLPLSLQKFCAGYADSDQNFPGAVTLANNNHNNHNHHNNNNGSDRGSLYASENGSDSSSSDSDITTGTSSSEAHLSREIHRRASRLKRAVRRRRAGTDQDSHHAKNQQLPTTIEQKSLTKNSFHGLQAQEESSLHHIQRPTQTSLFSPPITASLSSPSSYYSSPFSSPSVSPTSVKHVRPEDVEGKGGKAPRRSGCDDLTAAETLLALRSGSSTLTEDEDEDEDEHEHEEGQSAEKICQKSNNASTKKRRVHPHHIHRHRHRHHGSQGHHNSRGREQRLGHPDRLSLAVSSQSELFSITRPEFQRASF